MRFNSAFFFRKMITRAVLMQDPMWDAMHANLAFQKLCKKTTAPKMENITVGPQTSSKFFAKVGMGKAGQELAPRYGLMGETPFR
jgi:hypothetical protein